MKEKQRQQRAFFENIFTELSIEDPGGFRDMIMMSYEDFPLLSQNFGEFVLGRAFLTTILVGKNLNAHV